jgi:hypothetical protein
MLALTGGACRWEPKGMLLRLFFAAHLVTTGCRRLLRPTLALDPDDHRRIRLPPGPVRARLTNRNTPCPDKPAPPRP